MSLLDGINKQGFVSDRIPMPVDIVSDTAYVNSISSETVQFYYFANALLTCATAGSSTYTDWVALTSTSTFGIEINGKPYVINPDFTGDTSMNDVAASIQTAIRAENTLLAAVTCAWSTNHFVITAIKDESGENMANSISVLTNPESNTGTDIAGSSWMNGKYGSGVITPATLTTDAGQAAGVIIMGKLAYTGVLDSLGSMIGNNKDTSLSWTTNTTLPKKYLKEFPKHFIEDMQNFELVDIAYAVGKGLTTNGEWCLDSRTGTIVGRKADTGTSDAATYKVQSQATGSGSAVSSTVKITNGTVNLDVLTQDAAFGTASKGLAVFGKYQATPTTYTDGDAVPLLTDTNGRLVLSSDIEIGAVELKNGADDTRATINAANTARATSTTVLASQLVGADGTVPPTGSLLTNAPFMKLTDGTSNLTLGTGTTKNVPVGLNDGTTAIVFGTGTQKTVPTAISDGTTEADVIATINSLKTDLSSVAGTATSVGAGTVGNGVQRTTLASDDPAVTALQIIDDWDDGDKCKSVNAATATDVGGDPYFDNDGDNTAQALKAGAGNLYKFTAYNSNGTDAWVQFFDTAAGSVTVGTTPPVYVIWVPAGGAFADDFAGTSLSFGTAITYACTTTSTGAVDPTVGLVISAVFK